MSLLFMFRIITLTISGYLTKCSCYELPESYNKRLRPNVGGPPVEIRVGLYVESLGAIEESTMDFRLTLYFRKHWNDPRLAFNKTHERIFVSNDGDIFWSPDLYFLYEKGGHAHDITVPNIVTTIQPDGTVFRSTRVTLTSACFMSLHRFPFDSQRCSLNVLSYSYTTKDMMLTIKDEDVEIPKELIIPSFVLQSKWNTSGSVLNLVTAGNYSMVTISFTFHRQMQSFLLTVYIPSMLLVTVAWLSFCIDAEAAPARVSLGITTVLTITTMTAGMQESLPVVTYAKAIDIWLAACLFFVFTALIEFALANYLLIVRKKRKEAIEALEQSHKSSCGANTKLGLSDEQLIRYQAQYAAPLKTTPDVCDEETQKTKVVIEPWTADRVDCMARYIYPVAFTLFNFIYWPFYIYIDETSFY
ncbi:glycine receptor subunit alpha-2-like isoform X1 [Lytechinus pictus]|uniref:glycine receptor subunit alpha-2-like isoform X1 n=1 Tax=Lytechinus pictus TaxID=7653 RepID=UPI0030B9D17F